MGSIFVDADACPVKEEAVRVAERHGWPIFFVANAWMRLPDGPMTRRVVVPEGPDAADDWIADRALQGDIVVTADILLAARCVKSGAEVLGPTGKPFTEASIGMAVAMRNLTAQLRDAGEIKGHNAPFSRQDRSRFLQELEQAAQRILRRQQS